MGEALVDAHEMARILGVSYETVIRYARAGDIPSLRMGRLWRFQPALVLEKLATPSVDLWASPSRKKLRS
ncbi:helix-turn-helix domain-containing protein [Curtobacterium sp. VKM Ac-1376]|nr:helix-turn-helix domain-containing protein [Curtobacterium sp. VKM Ac-1376]